MFILLYVNLKPFGGVCIMNNRSYFWRMLQSSLETWTETRGFVFKAIIVGLNILKFVTIAQSVTIAQCSAQCFKSLVFYDQILVGLHNHHQLELCELIGPIFDHLSKSLYFYTKHTKTRTKEIHKSTKKCIKVVF